MRVTAGQWRGSGAGGHKRDGRVTGVDRVSGVPTLGEIRSLEEALHRPEVRRSRAAVAALLAEGFVEFGSSGEVFDRNRIIEHMAGESGADDGEMCASNYALRPLGHDAVLLTYETRREDRGGSGRHVLRCSVWTRDGAVCRMVFHQGTVKAQAGPDGAVPDR